MADHTPALPHTNNPTPEAPHPLPRYGKRKHINHWGHH